MPLVKFFRPLFTVILTCMVAWGGFSSPAFAADNSVDSFINGFWQAFGGVVGGATGTLVTCYTIDVLIFPFAPPVAVYLAPMCPAIGASVGGIGGVAGANAIFATH